LYFLPVPPVEGVIPITQTMTFFGGLIGGLVYGAYQCLPGHPLS
jgi:hypothetical protein